MGIVLVCRDFSFGGCGASEIAHTETTISTSPQTSPANRFRLAFRQTFLSLDNRNFRLFFWGQLISNTGNWLTNIALILLVLKLTKSGLAVGILGACSAGPLLFLSAWAGALADRYDKRRLLLWTQALEMCQSISLAIVAFMPHPPLWALYALALWGGTLLAFDNPFRRSFVPELVSDEQIPNAVVLYSAIVNLSRMFGPALAGFLIVTLGYGWTFALDALSYFAVLVCLLKMRPQEIRRQPAKTKQRGEVVTGVRYVMSLPILWISFAMLAATGMMSYNFSVTLPLFVTGALNSSERVFTLLYSTFSAGAVVSALFVARRQMVRMRHILIGAGLLGAAMLLLSLMPNVATATGAVFLVGMASIVYMTSITAIVQLEAKREMHGRALSLQTVLMGGTKLLGGPLLGWLADTSGARAPLFLGGIVCLAALGFGIVTTRRLGVAT